MQFDILSSPECPCKTAAGWWLYRGWAAPRCPGVSGCVSVPRSGPARWNAPGPFGSPAWWTPWSTRYSKEQRSCNSELAVSNKCVGNLTGADDDLGWPGLNLHTAEKMRQSVHQRRQQGLQLEARLHQLFHTRHHASIAGKHFALRRHHVRDECVTPTLLL